MNFKDIKTLPLCYYSVHQSLKHLPEWLERMADRGKNNGMGGLVLDPPYQREYVWTKKQKEHYMEWFLKKGTSGRDLYFNCATWQSSYKDPLEIVDGKQRLDAAMGFLNNKVKAFGLYCKEFEGKLDIMDHHFVIHIAKLKTRKEVVQWYIDMNTGGSIHTEKDLAPAYKILEEKIP